MAMFSPDWLALETTLKDMGEMSDGLFDLLRFIDAPPHLISLGRIADNLQHILPLCLKIYQENPAPFPAAIDDRLKNWQYLAETLERNSPRLQDHIRGFLQSAKTRRRAPLTSYYRSNGTYVNCWYRGPSGGREQFRVLQANLLLVDQYLRDKEQQLGQTYKNTRYEAQLALRHLDLKPTIVAGLPAIPLALPDYLQALTPLGTDSDINAIRIVVNYCVQQKDPIIRELPPSEDNAGGTRREKPPSDNEPENQGAPAEESWRKTLHLKKRSPKSEREHLEAGGAPNEVTQDFDLLLDSTDGHMPNLNNSSLRQHRRNMGKAAARLAAENQLLPTRWDNLSAWEVAPVIHALWNLATKPIEPNADNNPLRLASALSALLWLGLSIEELEHFQMHTSAKSLSEKTPPNTKGILVSKNNAFWVALPAQPKVSTPNPDPKALPCASYLLLPCPEIVHKVFLTLLQSLPQPLGKTPVNIFQEKFGKLESQIHDTFTQLSHLNGTRITAKRLSNYLVHLALQVEGGDIALNQLWSGHNHYLAKTKLHYTSIPVAKVQTAYRQACQRLSSEVFQDLQALHPSFHQGQLLPLAQVPDKTDAYAGSRFRPNRKTIKKLVAAMIAKHPGVHSRRPDHSPGGVARLHNSLVAYTILMTTYATGFRPVHQGGPAPGDIDWPSGLTVVSDKDGPEFLNTRLVWLPPVCLEQLRHYFVHLRNLASWLAPRNLDAAKRIWSVLNKVRLGEAETEDILYFFLDEASVALTPYRPVLLTRHLCAVGYQLKDNANRHFLRSELLESGCPTEVIDALMGHWDRGQEPWSMVSGLSTETFVSELQRTLEPILLDCGWVPLTGMDIPSDPSAIPLDSAERDLFSL